MDYFLKLLVIHQASTTNLACLLKYPNVKQFKLKQNMVDQHQISTISQVILAF